MECLVHREELEVASRERFEVVDITARVDEIVSRSRVSEGLLHVYTPHTTAALTINEAEPGLMNDILAYIKELTRPGRGWSHDRIDDNAHAHLGQSTFGHHVSIPVGGGRMLLGTWQRILLVEMDGPRRRRVIASLIGVG